jgi:protein involved in polysaccharide export with SLBB domain
MTQEEFELELTKRLIKYVREPNVSIYVSESRSRPVTVAGAVRQPGEHQVASSATLMKVIAQAGGTVDPGPTVVLTRPVEKGAIPHLAAKIDESGKYEYVELDLVEVMDGSSRAANLAVQPYDRITVSTVKVPVPKVYIAGEVVTPGQVELVTQKRVSITRLVAVAGGFSRTAKPSRTLVVHVNAAGERTSTETVNLSKILNGKAEDYQVSAGDMVIVPSSKLKTVIAATSQSLVSGSFIFLGRF